MIDTKETHTLVIGAGPIGIEMGITLQKENIPAMVIEKGCIANCIYQYPEGTNFLTDANKMEIENYPLTTQNDKPTKQEMLAYYRNIVMTGELEVQVYTEVIDILPRDEKGNIGVLIKDKNDNNTLCYCKKIVIATGGITTPNYISTCPQTNKRIHYYFNTAHPFTLKKTIVIGGGNSAVQAALSLSNVGASVSMFVRGSKLRDNVRGTKYKQFIDKVEKGKIALQFNYEFRAFEGDFVFMNNKLKNNIEKFEFEEIIALTGYKPNLRFLKKIGLQFSHNAMGMCCPYFNDKTMETNIPNIYLAGVVCGGQAWAYTGGIPNTRHHIPKIINHILSKQPNHARQN